jgi:hypothetical protein
MLITLEKWDTVSTAYTRDERFAIHLALTGHAPAWLPPGWYVDASKLAPELQEKLQRDFPQRFTGRAAR